MSYTNLIRWSGMAALVGGALLVVVDLLDGLFFLGKTETAAMTSSAWVIFNVLDVLLLILISLGLVGIYLRQAQKAGNLGLIGFLLFFLGLAMMSGALWSAGFIFPWLASMAPPELLETDPSGIALAGFLLATLLVALGGLLFGWASLQAGVLPRGAAVLLMIGAVLVVVLEFLELPFSGVVIGAAIAWMGYALWSSLAAESDVIPDVAT